MCTSLDTCTLLLAAGKGGTDQSRIGGARRCPSRLPSCSGTARGHVPVPISASATVTVPSPAGPRCSAPQEGRRGPWMVSAPQPCTPALRLNLHPNPAP